MKSFLQLVKQNLLFFILVFSVLILGTTIRFADTKINCFIKLNSFHNQVLNNFFILITYLGDGIFSISFAVIIMLGWRLYRLGIQLLLGFFISGIVAQILKTLFSAPRPMTLISHSTYHFFIDGISHTGFSSFPSGHTTSIFTLVTILIFSVKNSLAAVVLFAVAVIVGYSRIYLGQHFLEDVTAGSVLGVLTGLLIVLFTQDRSFNLKHFGIKRNLENQSYLF